MLTTHQRKHLLEEITKDLNQLSEADFYTAYEKVKTVPQEVARLKWIWAEAIKWYIGFQSEVSQQR